MAKYAHPEVLVTTDWVKENLDKPGIKLVEIDVDTKAYEAGHVPRSDRHLPDGQIESCRCAQPGRIHRQGHRAAGHERNSPTRRPHPGREERPVEHGRATGRHVQIRR